MVISLHFAYLFVRHRTLVEVKFRAWFQDRREITVHEEEGTRPRLTLIRLFQAACVLSQMVVCPSDVYLNLRSSRVLRRTLSLGSEAQLPQPATVRQPPC